LKTIWNRVATFLVKDLAARQIRVVGAILGASLMVNLAAGLVENIFELLRKSEWTWAAARFAGLAAVAILALFLGARAFRGVTAHRLVAQSRGRAPLVDVLILPVSLPNRGGQSRFDADMLVKVLKLACKDSSVTAMKGDDQLDFDKGDFLESFTCPKLWINSNAKGNYFSDFSWAIGFKTIDVFLKSSPRRLRAIHLVPSEESAVHAKTYYGPTLMPLIESRIKPDRAVEQFGEKDWETAASSSTSVHLTVHDGVDYNEFDSVQTKIQKIIAAETNRQKRIDGGACKIAIDVTGGSSAFSAAAAIESTREHVIYSYIRPLTESEERTAETLNDPRCYNVVAESVSGG
jgi:hypothetical protein